MKKLFNFSIIFIFNFKTVILFLLPYSFLGLMIKFRLYSTVDLFMFDVATIFILVLFFRQAVWAWKQADKLTFLIKE